MKEIIEYIVEFLCYGDAEAAGRVRIDGEVDFTLRYPSDEMPAIVCMEDGTVKVSPDLIYDTFFYISRAEELINSKRDLHGRFTAACSRLSENNRLLIPIVDEYAHCLMRALGVSLPDVGFANIYLTHDVDALTRYRHLRGALGGIMRGRLMDVLRARKSIYNDPIYTFRMILAEDAEVVHAKQVYFIKRTEGKGFDYPQYDLKGSDYRQTKDMLLNHDVRLGLHTSYYGKIDRGNYTWCRAHFLRCSISKMQELSDVGFTDDFSMGFPDRVGFRLQTTRAVRWINPETLTLTPLTLHPLTLMDCTLSGTNYMHLTEDEACAEAERILDIVRCYHGDVTLLWHNHIFHDEPWQVSLYHHLLQLLIDENNEEKTAHIV